jgi:hypothetical protein
MEVVLQRPSIFKPLLILASAAILFVAMPLTMGVILFLRNFEETRGLAAIMTISSEPAGEP